MATLVLVLLLCFVYDTCCYERKVYKIGGLFNDEVEVMAFQTATEIMNKKYQFSGLKIVAVPVIINTHNALIAYNNACQLMKDGIIGLFGPSSIHSSSYIQSLCDVKEIPHVETHRDLSLETDKAVVNVHPHPRILSGVLIDLVAEFQWDSFIIMYDTEENLLSISSLLEFGSLKHRIVLRQLETDSDNNIDGFRPLLTKVKLTGEKKFVLVCDTHLLESALKQLQEVGMMTDVYSYIIADLDMQTIELESFRYGGTNITGIRMVDPEQHEVISTAGDIQKMKSKNESTSDDLGVMAAWKFQLKSALIVDAVNLFYETIYSLTENDKNTINAKSIRCKSDDNWVDGYTIINMMKTKSVDGVTGTVKFIEGYRKDFKVDILELGPGGLFKIGDWNSTTRSLKIGRPYKPSPLEEDKQASIFNRTFTVLISISPPYAMLKEDTARLYGNDRYEGFCIDVINELAKLLKFNYTFIVQEDGANGNYNKTTDKWNGMIGEVVEGRADLAITDLTITSEREKAVDFTMPFMNLGISILYKKPEPVPPSLFMFASPFSWLVWVMLGVSYFVVSLAFFVMGRLSPAEWQNPYPCVEEPEYLINQFTIRNSLWFTIGALMQQGSEIAPIAISTRTASGIWWFFVLIMVSSYTANLAAFLTVTTPVTPFKSIYELAAQDKIKYGAKANGATANYFRDSNLTTYQNVWKYMVRHPENMMPDNDAGVSKVVNENYAFLMESTTIEYATERQCSLAQVGGLLDDKGYGIAMVKDSPYRHQLSREVLKLQETGVLTDLKIIWWKEKKGGGKCSRKPESGEATPLNLRNVGGVFLVLFMGSLLGLMGSFLELMLYVRRKAKSQKLSFKEELRKELNFFLNVKQNVKEVTYTDFEDSNDNQLIDKTRIEY